MSDYKYKFYSGRLSIKPGDTLLIPFGTVEPSEFKIVSFNRRKKSIVVEVTKETYTGKDAFAVGSMVELGTWIYDKWWCFKVEKLHTNDSN